jgi:hypothetical protein
MKRRLVIAASAVALLAAAIALPPQPTLASWVDAEYSTATLAAGSINPVTGVTCSISGGALSAKSVNLGWTAPASGLAPDSYDVTWPGHSQTVAGTSIIIGPGLLSLGTITFTIKSRVGSVPWVSSGVNQSVNAVTSLLVACI